MPRPMLSTARPRLSHIELLRIIAMLMVLVLHAAYESLGYPSPQRLQSDPAGWAGIIFTGQTCICCVDVFVLITGWFGTHFKAAGLRRIVYQVCFTAFVICAAVWAIEGKRPGSWGEMAATCTGYWFINSYLLLYIFSPVLNAFAEHAERTEMKRFLIVFFLFCIPLSFVFRDLNRGFSALSFFGLYLWGRYLRLYLSAEWQQVRARVFLIIFAVSVGCMTAAFWTYVYFRCTFLPSFPSFMTAYTNPFVLLNATCLLLFFSRLRFTCRTVNFLAAGSLAAYLTHQHPYVRQHYLTLIRSLHHDYPTPLFLLLAAAVIAAIFLLSVGLEHFRAFSARLIGRIERPWALRKKR